jgi:16S rRNA G966 N2-methylase RsmD
VLKLLQKSYAGKVKLIYIDPPYNTGKDFVYPDNYRDSIRNYLELTGQVDGRSARSVVEHRGVGTVPHRLAEHDVSAPAP